MWETRHSIVDWDCSKIQTLLETLKIPNQPRGDFCVIFGSPTFVPKNLDEKETNFSLSQFYRIRNHFVGCWTANGWIRGVAFFKEHPSSSERSLSKRKIDDQVPRSRARSEIRSTDPNTKSKRSGNRDIEQLSHVDYVTTNAYSPQREAQLYVFEDNETVIKMIIRGRSPTMRNVSRTHRVALNWLFDRVNLDSKIQIKHVDTNLLTCWPKVIHPWWVETSSSFAQHHEFLDVFLQPISVELTARKIVEESGAGRKTWRRGTCGCEIETNDEFSVEDCQPVSNSGFECIWQPGDTRSTQFEFRPYRYGGDPLRKVWMKTQHRVLKCGIQMRTRSPVQRDPWRKRQRKPLVQSYLTSTLRYQGAMLVILRKSIQMYDRNWVVLKEVMCLTLTSTRWSGESLCHRQRRRAAVHLGQDYQDNLNTTKNTNFEKVKTLSESEGWVIWNIHDRMEYNSMDENDFAARQSSQAVESGYTFTPILYLVLAKFPNILKNRSLEVKDRADHEMSWI